MGWARFSDGYLIDAGSGKPEDIIPHIQSAEIIVFELPQFYRARFSKGDPNKLAKLTKQVGYVQGIAFAGNTDVRYVEMLPADWKGQLPKKIVHARARAVMTEHTNDLRLTHDAWDAIALGLVYLKRLVLR